jgi:hypothetical protein
MEYVGYSEPSEPHGHHETSTSSRSRDNAFWGEQFALACQGLGLGLGTHLDQVCYEFGLY